MFGPKPTPIAAPTMKEIEAAIELSSIRTITAFRNALREHVAEVRAADLRADVKSLAESVILYAPSDTAQALENARDLVRVLEEIEGEA